LTIGVKRLWCVIQVRAASSDGYRGRPAAESLYAVQAQRTAPSQDSLEFLVRPILKVGEDF
jgi:hypothetical protein